MVLSAGNQNACLLLQEIGETSIHSGWTIGWNMVHKKPVQSSANDEVVMQSHYDVIYQAALGYKKQLDWKCDS
ncbi:MAG: hypothetical protein ABW094_19745 [Candidatus Thiodiazotropha sp.]